MHPEPKQTLPTIALQWNWLPNAPCWYLVWGFAGLDIGVDHGSIPCTMAHWDHKLRREYFLLVAQVGSGVVKAIVWLTCSKASVPC